MKLQVAIDRVSLDKALELAESIKHTVDIIEVGTSLVKDYGLESVRQIRERAPDVPVLADIKTMDEGAYEFEAAYAAGADIATVMGAAATGTVAACYDIAVKYGKDIMIDLLETSPDKMEFYQQFHKSLYCVHLPKDGPTDDIVDHVSRFIQDYPSVKYVAVAGGIKQEQVRVLARMPVEICIVGSAVTGAQNPAQAAEQFARVLRNI